MLEDHAICERERTAASEGVRDHVIYQLRGREKYLTTIMVGASRAPPNGTAESAPAEVSSLPPVIGINFGNTYASIAVFTKVRLVIQTVCVHQSWQIYRKDLPKV
jgi:hypothetical protein